MTGGPQLALVVYLLFYAICLAMTWWFYLRRGPQTAGAPSLAEARI
jgi:NNP family nitrate/nitrite transporter-like MFS transporter